MKKNQSGYPFLFAAVLSICYVGTTIAQTAENTRQMNSIRFSPKEFENIDFESMETVMCPCSPNFPHELEDVNILKINVPEMIFFHGLDEKIIPVCIAYTTSFLRELKYLNFSQKKIHIKHENEDIVYSAEYFDKRRVNKIPDISLEENEYWQEKSNEVQKLSDDELDRAFYSGNILNVYSHGYLNINALDYVDVPMVSGRYEIWVTYYGLESNRTIVEVIEESHNDKLCRTITQAVKAYLDRDENRLNSLALPDFGVAILYRRGVSDNLSILDRFSFDNPEPEYLPYNTEFSANYTIHFEELPVFSHDCFEWNKPGGIYCDTTKTDRSLSSAARAENMAFGYAKWSDDEIAKFEKIEDLSHKVIVVGPDSDEYIFFLTLYEGEWYISLINRNETGA